MCQTETQSGNKARLEKAWKLGFRIKSVEPSLEPTVKILSRGPKLKEGQKRIATVRRNGCTSFEIRSRGLAVCACVCRMVLSVVVGRRPTAILYIYILPWV